MERIFGGFPSLHPLIVHFPLVLLVAAPLLQAGGLIARKRDWLLAASFFLTAGAISSALAAYVFHAEPFDPAPGARAIFIKHEAYAAYALWAALAALAAKLLGALPRLRTKTIELIALALMLAAGSLVLVSGHLGAQLTHIFRVQAE